MSEPFKPRTERMFMSHSAALSSQYGDALHDMKFEAPRLIEKDNDSVLSDSKAKKVAFVTRHLLTADVTHCIIFEKEFYSRI